MRELALILAVTAWIAFADFSIAEVCPGCGSTNGSWTRIPTGYGQYGGQRGWNCRKCGGTTPESLMARPTAPSRPSGGHKAETRSVPTVREASIHWPPPPEPVLPPPISRFPGNMNDQIRGERNAILRQLDDLARKARPAAEAWLMRCNEKPIVVEFKRWNPGYRLEIKDVPPPERAGSMEQGELVKLRGESRMLAKRVFAAAKAKAPDMALVLGEELRDQYEAYINELIDEAISGLRFGAAVLRAKRVSQGLQGIVRDTIETTFESITKVVYLSASPRVDDGSVQHELDRLQRLHFDVWSRCLELLKGEVDGND